MLRPYLVQSVRSGEEVRYQAQPEVLREVISPQAAQQLRAVMQRSVEIGYAAPAALPGVTVGAKTGTAETPTGVPHSWFVALAPVEQPLARRAGDWQFVRHRSGHRAGPPPL